MRDDHIDLCGQIDFTRTEAMPLLARDAHFSFACNGCGDCCRGREDIVLSGFDLWRIAARLRLPPQIVARGYCRASIGTVSHLPVLRLAPVKENRNNCPFLTGDHCAIHDAEPLVCALYPLAQEISRKGQVSYFLQPTGCGGQVIEARWGTILLVTMSDPGTDRCALGADLHDTGRHGGTAGCAAQPGAGAPDAGQALAGAVFWLRLCRTVLAAAGEKPALAGR